MVPRQDGRPAGISRSVATRIEPHRPPPPPHAWSSQLVDASPKGSHPSNVRMLLSTFASWHGSREHVATTSTTAPACSFAAMPLKPPADPHEYESLSMQTSSLSVSSGFKRSGRQRCQGWPLAGWRQLGTTRSEPTAMQCPRSCSSAAAASMTSKHGSVRLRGAIVLPVYPDPSTSCLPAPPPVGDTYRFELALVSPDERFPR